MAEIHNFLSQERWLSNHFLFWSTRCNWSPEVLVLLIGEDEDTDLEAVNAMFDYKIYKCMLPFLDTL